MLTAWPVRRDGRKLHTCSALFSERATIAVVVVTFLAVLELSREGLIDVAQAEAFAPIYVQLKGGPYTDEGARAEQEAMDG